MAEAVIVSNDYGDCYAQEKLTIDNTAGGKALTQSVYETRIGDLGEGLGPTVTGPPADAATEGNTVTKFPRPRVAFITLETQPIRYGFTGVVTVDANTGMPLAAGQTLVVRGYNKIRTLRLIRSTGSSGTVIVSYFK